MNPIEKHYQKACELAEEKVEKLARKILLKNPELHEFVMAMGDWFFTLKAQPEDEENNAIKEGEICWDVDSDPRFTEISNFIMEWDEYLKLTGIPMRFTATGPKITDW